MILQALKNMYPKASEKVLKAVMKDLEKCRGKNMSTEELADWIGKLVTAHIIEEALKITEDDSKPSQVGDESSFAVTEVANPTGSHPLCVQNKSPYQVGLGLLAEAKGFVPSEAPGKRRATERYGVLKIPLVKTQVGTQKEENKQYAQSERLCLDNKKKTSVVCLPLFVCDH